jgi:hypothetical protein
MNTTQWTERDKYGRTVQHNAIGVRTICVRVTAPRCYREEYGISHWVTDWTADPCDRSTAVTECRTIGEARAAVARIMARETAKQTA